MEPLESLWNNLLSRDESLIKLTFGSISPMEQHKIISHLERMITEDGWHHEQVESAARALSVLKKDSNALR